jgi:hypothetical protein
MRWSRPRGETVLSSAPVFPFSKSSRRPRLLRTTSDMGAGIIRIRDIVSPETSLEQILAYFIGECSIPHTAEQLPENKWTLYVDGASSQRGAGAEVAMIGPKGGDFELCIENSPTSKNTAEYEALIAGAERWPKE